MTDRRDIEDLKALAYARAGDVLGSLGIRESTRAGYISMCNPKRKDKKASFTIWVKGGSISFRDEAYTEIRGDVLQLVAYMRDWTHLENGGFLEAKRFLEDVLGVRTLAPEQRRTDMARARRRAREAADRDARELEKKVGLAQQVFFNAKPIAADTRAELYLRGRGIDFGRLPIGPRGGERRPGSLRYLMNERHSESGTAWPCMVACCVAPATGEIRAIHRTWLQLDGSAKAPVTPPRKCWPEVGGLIIPIWKGESWLSVPDAIKCGLRENVVLCEGIETALSAVLAAPQFRTWAVISLGNLQKIALPECIDGVLVSRENDWTKPQALASFSAGKRALEAQGVPVSEIRAFAGSDLNDTLMGVE